MSSLKRRRSPSARRPKKSRRKARRRDWFRIASSRGTDRPRRFSRIAWKAYMEAYEECLGATSTRHAPWYVVPADDKDSARLIVSQVILDAFNDVHMEYPKVTAQRRKELEAIREGLAK